MNKTVFNAVYSNNFDNFMKFLNDPNFDPNIKNDMGHSLLLTCILQINGKEKHIKELLKVPNLNLELGTFNDTGSTALMTAASFFNLEIVKTLIDAGANVNAQNKRGWSPLMSAVNCSNSVESFQNRESIVKLLLDSEADINLKDKDGWTALMVAIKSSNIKIITILLEAGADPNIRNIKNKMAIDMTRDIVIQLLLIKAGSLWPMNRNSNIKNSRFSKLLEFIILETRIEISQYKKLLTNDELYLLGDCVFEENIEGLEILKKYLKTAKNMIKLRPGSEKYKEMEKKFKKSMI